MKTWAMLAQKGGSGKSTIALHLAIVAHAKGLKTAVLDTDPQRSMADLAQTRTADWPRFASMTAGELPRELGKLAADRFDLAVIDTNGRADRDTQPIAKLAGLIIIPVRPSILDVRAITPTIRQVRDAGAIDRAVIVVNGISARTDEAREVMPTLSKMARVASAQLGDRVDYRRALVAGLGVTETAPKSRAALEIEALYSELDGY
jgi:chromosome partitioning protein